MVKKNREGKRFIGIVAALIGLFLIYSVGSTMMYRYKVGELTEHMKTACVGRFLIDLPVKMDFSYSHMNMYGYWVSTIPEAGEAFDIRVAAREKYLNAEPNSLGKKNIEKSEEISGNGFRGKIFEFGRESIEGVENDKTIYYPNVQHEAYVHSNGRSFDFKIEYSDPINFDELKNLISRLRLVSVGTIPTEPGFCFGPGIFIDPPPAESAEGVALFAGFPDHPDLAMAFSTRSKLKPSGPGLLQRDTEVDAEMPWKRTFFNKIRKGKRAINGIDGEEVVEKVHELNAVNVFLFDWEVSGMPNNVFVPSMHLELSTGHPVHAGAKPVPTFLGDEALVELWDKISSSIRVRPTTPTTSVEKAPPSGPKLGDSASAGEVCPQSGWWQCKEGDQGVAVFGGQRQFLKKGQRMPQALLLPRQTIWEKVRGLQSSYESKEPTAWTLTDRRSKARVKPNVPLAPPMLQSGSSSYGADTSGSPAEVGSFVRTGAACPASGWWSCQDSEALDGTRWFAKGELLPGATFRIVHPKLRFRTDDVEVFQRRSTWQLVREATGPDEAKADV